jgi:hypothetical protein
MEYPRGARFTPLENYVSDIHRFLGPVQWKTEKTSRVSSQRLPLLRRFGEAAAQVFLHLA